MTRDERLAVVDRWVAAVNTGDYAALERLIAPTFVQHTRGLPPGPAAAEWAVRMLRTGFPDLTVTVDWRMTDGDRVGYRATTSGTHTGTFLGHAPTGRAFRATSLDVLRVADGRVVERWTEFDTFGMLQQLGIVPAPDAPSRSTSRRLPPGPAATFTVHDVQRDALGFLSGIISEYGDLVSYRVADRTVVLVNHPDLVRHVLQDNSKNYVKAGTPDMLMLKPMLGDGLLTTDGDAWVRQRRLAQPGFHRARIEGFAGLINERTRSLIETWRAREERHVELTDEMTGLTTRIVAQALFGVDITDAVDMFGDAVQAMNEVMGSFEPGNQEAHLKFHFARTSIDRLVHRIIDERRRENGSGGEDFLSMLLDTREEDGSPLSAALIRDQVMTLLMAGHETTAKALTWTLYLLDRHPGVQAALRREVDRVIGTRLPSLADLPALRLTSMVLQEAMRLYPPVWIMARTAVADDEMRACEIPAGAAIVISPYAMHRRADLYPDPERFDPRRFDGTAEDRPPFAYLPFSGGPRQCIGRHFAMLELQLALAQLTARVQIRVAATARVEPEALVTLRPRYGMPATVTLRS